MIIAGPEMAVGDERRAFAPHDQRQLAVRFELDETEDDLRAGALQVARPTDVGFFVKTRLQFDKRGD